MPPATQPGSWTSISIGARGDSSAVPSSGSACGARSAAAGASNGAEPSKMLAVVPRWFLRGGQQNHLCAFTAYSLEIQHITGEPGGTRTHDPLIKSQVLYRLSYGLRAACVGGGLFPVNSGAAGFKRKWRLFGLRPTALPAAI